jgi:tetratricopeptide (TPR) repeat protein
MAASRLDDVAGNLQESLQIAQSVFGNGLRLIPVLTALADLYLQKGDTTQGWMLINRASEFYKANPPSNWLPATDMLRVSAIAASRRQSAQDAADFLDQALKIAESRLSAGSLLTARIIETRGDLALAAGQPDQAGTEYKRAMAIRQRVLGPGHPDIARGETEIAQLSGFPAGVVDSVYKDALNSIATENGNDSLGLIPTLEKYISFLRVQKRETDAAEQEKKLGRLMGRQE